MWSHKKLKIEIIKTIVCLNEALSVVLFNYKEYSQNIFEIVMIYLYFIWQFSPYLSLNQDFPPKNFLAQ